MSGSSDQLPEAAAPAPAAFAADDNPVTRQLIVNFLGRQGYRVETFANGADLLARAAVTPPNVVILDIMMPGKDGYSTLRALKTAPALRHIPVLILSSANHGEDVARCLDAGAADYMAKPFSPQELVSRVRRLQ